MDAGDNTAVSASTDLDGNPRIVGNGVDMGAYERPCEAIQDVSAECTSRGVRATVLAALPPGSTLTLVLNRSHARTVVLDELGVGVARWKLPPGPAEVCLLGCAGACHGVNCE